ncbi:MAG TPA: hypothetical protein VIO35_03030 [Chloroflexota bacterium]
MEGPITPFPTAGATAVPTDVTAVAPPCPDAPITTDAPANGNTAKWSSTWYRSPDGQIWASAPGLQHPGGDKVLWVKPVGGQLTVQGKRLDGAAGPLYAVLSTGYESMDYQASFIWFPSSGCWEVEARANTTTWRFVVSVK